MLDAISPTLQFIHISIGDVACNRKKQTSPIPNGCAFRPEHLLFARIEIRRDGQRIVKLEPTAAFAPWLSRNGA
jgi:hypothetical protein